jgi:hypothetical protein
MDQASLAEVIQQPDVHRRLLGTYEGAYALGVTTLAEKKGRVALLLRVEGDEPTEFPSHIFVDGEDVPVIVKGGFKPPKRL